MMVGMKQAALAAAAALMDCRRVRVAENGPVRDIGLVSVEISPQIEWIRLHASGVSDRL
jgi:hypothetical protein